MTQVNIRSSEQVFQDQLLQLHVPTNQPGSGGNPFSSHRPDCAANHWLEPLLSKMPTTEIFPDDKECTHSRVRHFC